MVHPDDEQIKSYLKEFRPVDPQPLPAKKHLIVSRHQLAVAAVAAGALAATVTLTILFSRTHKHGVPTGDGSSVTQKATTLQASHPIASSKHSEMGTPALTKLALEDSEAFNAVMTEKLKTQLPTMKDERSTLRVLAKE